MSLREMLRFSLRQRGVRRRCRQLLVAGVINAKRRVEKQDTIGVGARKI